MLHKLSPQKVKHGRLGYVVQVGDRYSVEYIEADRKVRIEVDFGMSVAIYRDSINEWILSSGTTAITPSDAEEVLSRVESALQFMGQKTEVC